MDVVGIKAVVGAHCGHCCDYGGAAFRCHFRCCDVGHAAPRSLPLSLAGCRFAATHASRSSLR
nr:hypothetical protein SHINE37_40929 [Rhizobiaceae bacterium]